MFVTQPSRAHEILFYINRYVGWPVACLLAFDGLVASAYLNFDWKWVALPHIPLSLFGSAIGVMVGFRISSAYGRWWEARQLWGAIVNDSRSLARQALSFASASATRVTHLQIAYVNALRLQLREQAVLPELKTWLNEKDLASLEGQKNPALTLQQMISNELATARSENRLSDFTWMQIDETLVRLMNTQGGLERIKNTPMPKQYVRLIAFFVFVYSILLPFGLVQNLEVMTPVGSSALAIIFITLNKIGGEIEAPFQNQDSDLALTSITTTIEIGLRQLLNETGLPTSAKAEAGVLW